jgi:hypothetical protein
VVPPGSVLVRVGSNGVPCPKGKKVALYPEIELVWPDSEENPTPRGALSIVWKRRETDTTPVKHLSDAKWISIIDSYTGEEWVQYRVSARERDEFERLRETWNMWVLTTSRNSDENTSVHGMFNNGAPFMGKTFSDMETVVLDNAADLLAKQRSIWIKGLENNNAKVPDHIRDECLAIIDRIPAVMERLGGGPLPWIPRELPHWGRPDDDGHEYIVHNYINLLATLSSDEDLNRPRGTGWETDDSKSRKLEMEYCVSMLRRAKIFEISKESYNEIHEEVDRYCTEDIAQLTFHPASEGPVSIPNEEKLLLFKRQTEACSRLPFPNRMPFDHCWFAVSSPVGLTNPQMESRGMKPTRDPHVLVGMLATSSGEMHEFFRVSRDGNSSLIRIITHRVSPEMSQPWMEKVRTDDAPTTDWMYDFSLAPFILHKLVDLINSHQTIIVSQRSLSRRMKNKLGKELRTTGNRKPLPPPFYTVYLKDSVIREIIRTTSTGLQRAALSHRFDVRGHWASRIFRGPLPMSPEFELDLENRKYKIFKTTKPDQWVIDIMRDKGIPMRAYGEWIAIKRWWRKSYVKGPDDGQYIPSTRKPTMSPRKTPPPII